MNQELLLRRYAQKFGAEIEQHASLFSPCICLKTESPDIQNQSDWESHQTDSKGLFASRLGGAPCLAPGVGAPVDRQDRPMMFLGQLNFAQIPIIEELPKFPPVGILSWFVNRDLRFDVAKEKFNFSLVWHAGTHDGIKVTCDSVLAEEQSLLFEPSLCPTQSAREDSPVVKRLQEISRHRLFGDLPNYERTKQICAFAMNGITWTPARSNDSCYEHLVTAALSWRLLWLLPAELSKSRLPDLALLIRLDDLAEADLNKAWMVMV